MRQHKWTHFYISNMSISGIPLVHIPPPSGCQVFVVTHKRKITFEHHGSHTISATAANESQLDGGTHSTSKDGSGSTPLDGNTARPHNLMERIKNWGRNLTHSSDQSLGDSLSLKSSCHQSVIIFIPENEDYLIYNLDAKLGEWDGHTSIDFRCSASTDGESSFRDITLEIEFFRLGNVNSQYQDHGKCHPTQYSRQGSNSDKSHRI